MGSYDGAEICEWVGLYLLSQLQNLNINVGLYRDDGLAVTNQTPREAEMKKKKKLCQIFKDNNLRIAVEANKKVTDFLDTTSRERAANMSLLLYHIYKKIDGLSTKPRDVEKKLCCICLLCLKTS